MRWDFSLRVKYVSGYVAYHFPEMAQSGNLMLALSPSVFGGFSSSANSSFPVKTEQVLYESFGEGLL